MTAIASFSKPAIRTPSAHKRVLRTPVLSRRVACRYRVGEYNEADAGPEDYNAEEHKSIVQTGIVFSPASELSKTLEPLEAATAQLGPSGVPRVSIGRMDYAVKAEVAINEQIAVELNNSYVYLSAAAYFGRDNVGLPGFAAHFQHSSDDEREHALRLIEFQVRRGGRVVLAALLPPPTEFDHEQKGDALHAAEIALSLEKLNFAKLRALHSLGDEADDASITHFIEDYLLDEQSLDVKEAAVLVSQLQRAGKGLGVFTIDYALQRKYGVKGAESPMAVLDGNLPQVAVTPLL